MAKVYQPIVIEQTEDLLYGLVESGFFDDYEITNLTFAKELILEKINEKYISGLMGEKNLDDELFTEEEFTKLLQELVAGSLLYDLKEGGYLNSYEDEQTEELFFLTEKGKKFLEDKNKGLD